MFINYELLLNGYRTIYVGESMPLSIVKDIKNYFDNITFITYTISYPFAEDMNRYIRNAKAELLDDDHTQLYIFGKNAQFISPALLGENIKVFDTIKDLADIL
jgi:hypothetical protein